MDIQAIRQAAIETPLKVQAVATPFWVLPDGTSTNGHVYLRDLPGDEMIGLENQCKDANGKIDASKMTALMLIKSLVAYDANHNFAPIFSVADVDVVKKQGTTTLMPLSKEVSTFLGVNPDAVETAKKNSNSQVIEGFISHLPENSDAPLPNSSQE